MPVKFNKSKPAEEVVDEEEIVEEASVDDDDIPFDTDDDGEVDVDDGMEDPEPETAKTTKKKATKKKATQKTAAKAAPPSSQEDRVARYAHTGDHAKQAYEKAEDDSNIPFRYRMQYGEERKITFLDGNLDPKTGFFDTLMVHEHVVPMAGSYPTYVCTDRAVREEDREPCPICAKDRGPYLVAFFTVIDHTGYTTKQGKKVQNVTRVYAAKRRTMSKLLRLATKHGGLAGCRFDVTRLDGEANTGETFDFVKKFPVDALCSKYKTKVYDYSTVTNFKTRDELIAMGIGGHAIGGEPGSTDGDDIDVDEDL
jgi:hypothetical protein